MQKLLLHVCLLLCAPAVACAWPGRIVAVTDGDTITVAPADGAPLVKIRLHGIDAPERAQHGGESARNFVSSTGLHKEVEVAPHGAPDRYKRTVAVVYLPSGESLQELLLKNGWAWIWPRYCNNCAGWETMQRHAEQTGRGVWKEKDPVPPWEWRRNRLTHRTDTPQRKK